MKFSEFYKTLEEVIGVEELKKFPPKNTKDPCKKIFMLMTLSKEDKTKDHNKDLINKLEKLLKIIGYIRDLIKNSPIFMDYIKKGPIQINDLDKFVDELDQVNEYLNKEKLKEIFKKPNYLSIIKDDIENICEIFTRDDWPRLIDILEHARLEIKEKSDAIERFRSDLNEWVAQKNQSRDKLKEIFKKPNYLSIIKDVIENICEIFTIDDLPRLKGWLNKFKSKLTKNGEKTDAIDSFIRDLDEFDTYPKLSRLLHDRRLRLLEKINIPQLMDKSKLGVMEKLIEVFDQLIIEDLDEIITEENLFKLIDRLKHARLEIKEKPDARDSFIHDLDELAQENKFLNMEKLQEIFKNQNYLSIIKDDIENICKILTIDDFPWLRWWLKKLKSKLTKNGEKTDAIDSFIHDLDEWELKNQSLDKLKEIFKNQNYLSVIKDYIENICEIYTIDDLPRLRWRLNKLKSKLTKNGEKTDAIDSFIHDLDELAQDKEFLNMEKVKLKEIFKNQNYLSIIKDNIENICEILTINNLPRLEDWLKKLKSKLTKNGKKTDVIDRLNDVLDKCRALNGFIHDYDDVLDKLTELESLHDYDVFKRKEQEFLHYRIWSNAVQEIEYLNFWRTQEDDKFRKYANDSNNIAQLAKIIRPYLVENPYFVEVINKLTDDTKKKIYNKFKDYLPTISLDGSLDSLGEDLSDLLKKIINDADNSELNEFEKLWKKEREIFLEMVFYPMLEHLFYEDYPMSKLELLIYEDSDRIAHYYKYATRVNKNKYTGYSIKLRIPDNKRCSIIRKCDSKDFLVKLFFFIAEKENILSNNIFESILNDANGFPRDCVEIGKSDYNITHSVFLSYDQHKNLESSAQKFFKKDAPHFKDLKQVLEFKDSIAEFHDYYRKDFIQINLDPLAEFHDYYRKNFNKIRESIDRKDDYWKEKSKSKLFSYINQKLKTQEKPSYFKELNRYFLKETDYPEFTRILYTKTVS